MGSGDVSSPDHGARPAESHRRPALTRASVMSRTRIARPFHQPAMLSSSNETVSIVPFRARLGLSATPQTLYLSSTRNSGGLRTCSVRAKWRTSNSTGSTCPAPPRPRAISIFTRSRWHATTGWCSSTPNIPASPLSIPCTASRSCGARALSQSSRPRTVVI